ncbi:MAG: restriction endonuclease subunit S [Kiritimatiellae bacterium]|nr:restriction endonuclease subunit S [Kiritimatiellia bacterium]
MTKEKITRLGADKSGSKLISKGTLLLSFKLSLGKRAFAGCDLFTNEAIAALQVLDHKVVDRNYLYWALGSIDYDLLVDRAAKGKTLNKAKLKVLQIPLPPLDEQKRIAAILDAADALRSQRRESLAELDRLVQSTFIDMFGDPVANPKGWEVAELRKHTSKVGSGATPRGGNESYKADGVALIRSLNVRNGKFQWRNLARIDDDQARKLSNVAVDENDVLLNITGASVARVCRAPKDIGPARVNQHVCIIRPTSAIDPRFLEKLLLTDSMKSKLLGIGESGATRQAITKAQVLALEIIFPPLALQQRFAEIVQSIEKQKALQRAHLAELDTLFGALQQRAFNGELST